MNVKAITNKAVKLHAKAIGKLIVVIINKEKYIVWFNPNNGNFETTMPDMTEGPTWNTRKISVACNWLREYMSN